MAKQPITYLIAYAEKPKIWDRIPTLIAIFDDFDEGLKYCKKSFNINLDQCHQRHTNDDLTGIQFPFRMFDNDYMISLATSITEFNLRPFTKIEAL